MNWKGLCLLSLVGFTSFSQAAPSRVLLIRHAEKPLEESDHLSEKGFERAKALAEIFVLHPEFANQGLPVAYFAAKYIEGESSNRCVETMTPLAEKYDKTIFTPFLPKKNREMAQLLLKDPSIAGKVVMVAWTHSNIPILAQELGVLDAPTDWDSRAFDRVWVIDFGTHGVHWSDRPQNILPGDSQND